MLKGLYLDDIRMPEDYNRGVSYPKNVEWTIIRDSNDFVDAIDSGLEFNIISFDHYLGDQDTWTGEDCLMYFIHEYICREREYPIPKMVFHSADTSKRNDMKAMLEHCLDLYEITHA